MNVLVMVALFMLGLALLVVKRVLVRPRLHGLRRRETAHAAAPQVIAHLDAVPAKGSPGTDPHPARLSDPWDKTAALIPDHALGRPNYIAPEAYARAAFDYLIVRNPGREYRQVPDRGGFSEVPILLEDRRGVCYLTYRRILLN